MAGTRLTAFLWSIFDVCGFRPQASALHFTLTLPSPVNQANLTIGRGDAECESCHLQEAEAQENHKSLSKGGGNFSQFVLFPKNKFSLFEER